MAPFSWWPLLGLVFLLAIFLRIYPLAAFAVMLIVISWLARWWNRRALFGITYLRKPIYWRGYPGERITLHLEVENRKFLPVPWLRVVDVIPVNVGPEDETALRPTHIPDFAELVSLFSLRWYERDRRNYTLLLRKRGIYSLGPSRLESGDLFGIFESQVEEEHRDLITVFPEVLPLQALRLPSDDPFGDRRSRRRLHEDPNLPMGVRDYLPEDDFRRVHWPATAHTGELKVKVFQPVAARVIVVCLNVSTFQRYWEGTDPELLEHLVKATAAVVQLGLEDGYKVGLVSNGCLAHSDHSFRVLPGRSPGQLAHLLTALAGVTPFVTGSFDRFLIAEMPHLPYGASLVILTGIMTPALTESILTLKRHNRRITLLSFAKEPPPVIPGVNVFHRPFLR